jgi:hypothetical protein
VFRHLASICLLIILTLPSGCAFYPQVAEHQSYSENCQMITRQLTLESQVLGAPECGDSAEACLVLYIGIPAASLVVSGSAVLAGNTLHWLEYHGRCEQGVVNTALSKF